MILPGLAALAAWILYELTNAPGLTWGDSGEFIAASSTLGIGHPYGHPLYWLAGRIAILLFPSDPAMAMNHLSALAGAVTVFFVGMWARQISSSFPRRRESGAGADVLDSRFRGNDSIVIWGTLIPTLIFATGRTFWSQALFTEVYTFQAAFVAAGFYLFQRWIESPTEGRFLAGSAFLFGLSVTLGMYALIPIGLATLAFGWRRIYRPDRQLILAGIAFLVGLSPWIYFFVRPLAGVSFSVAPLCGWNQFLDYLQRSSYADFRVAGWQGLGASFQQTGLTLWEGLGGLGCAAILFTFGGRIRRVVPTQAGTQTGWALIAVGTTLIFAILLPLKLSYRQMVDMDVYFIPALLLFTPAIAAGAVLLARRLPGWAMVALLVVFLAAKAGAWVGVDAFASVKCEQFADYLDRNLPEGARVFPVSDEVAFPIFAKVFAEGNPKRWQVVTSKDSTADYREIDIRFFDVFHAAGSYEFAGPFLTNRGDPSAWALETAFVSEFSYSDERFVKDRVERMSLARLWSRRGLYWSMRYNGEAANDSLRSHDLSEAIACYAFASQFDDFSLEGAEHLGNLALMRGKAGQIDMARMNALRGLYLNGLAAEPREALFQVAVIQQDWAEALQQLEALAKVSPTPGEVWLDIATLYAFKLQEPAKARDAYERGISLGGKRRGALEGKVGR